MLNYLTTGSWFD